MLGWEGLNSSVELSAVMTSFLETDPCGYDRNSLKESKRSTKKYVETKIGDSGYGESEVLYGSAWRLTEGQG